ncbi:MAG TPA: phytanoyl-CoA dioxygenase family protein [Myxococcota bacterium]|nr:phytanoyl-CoA dioxygenase family protein [Myxococcota bacterium]
MDRLQNLLRRMRRLRAAPLDRVRLEPVVVPEVARATGSLPDDGASPLRSDAWSFFSESDAARARLVARGDDGPRLFIRAAPHRIAVLYQELAQPEPHRSHHYVFEAWVRCRRPGSVRLWVDDGVEVNQWADANQGSKGWERISIEGIVSHASERFRVNVHISPDARLELRDARLYFEWRPASTDPTLEDLVEDLPDHELPRLDRRQIDERGLSERQRYWRENGYLVLPGLVPHDLVDAYCRVRERIEAPNGYPTVNPYVEVEEIKALCLHEPLMAVLEELIGEPMGMHLNLTGWVSTERAWHQDSYLNPPGVNNYYAAVWFALDDISPDAGPFEYIPGSHRWFQVSRERVLRFVPPEERTGVWPKTSESFLVPILEQEIERRAVKPVPFLGRKGDVLIWNGHLMHRGSAPRDPSLLRKTIITHYSSIRRRKGMFVPTRTGRHGYYF